MSAGRSDGGAAARPGIFCCIYDDAVPPCASRRSQLWRIALVWGFRISCPSPPSCPHCRVGPFAPIQTMKGKHSVVISPPLVPASPRSVMLLRGVRVASVTCDPGRSREVGSGASLRKKMQRQLLSGLVALAFLSSVGLTAQPPININVEQLGGSWIHTEISGGGWLPDQPEGKQYNGAGPSSGSMSGNQTVGGTASGTPGDGSWMSASGGGHFYESYVILYTPTEPGEVWCQGNALVEGVVTAYLRNAVGSAYSAAVGDTEVAYGGTKVSAHDKESLAVTAGQEGQVGIQTGYLGIMSSYVATTNALQQMPLGNARAGLPAEASVATVSFSRKLAYGYNINAGAVMVEGEVNTAARVRFALKRLWSKWD